MGVPDPLIRAEPPLSEWPGLVRRGPLDETQRTLRAELGLPTDRPVVMTGHQPILWHPGILSKYITASATADAIDGVCAWLVVDQDAVEPMSIEAPIRDASGGLRAQELRFSDETSVGESAATRASVTPIDPDIDGEYALTELASRIGAIRGALEARVDEASFAKQVTRANLDLMGDLIPDAPLVFASELSGTTFFRELIEDMRADPSRVTRAYNEAAKSHPSAQIAPLRANEDGDLYELPLWSLEPGASRKRVHAHELGDLDPEALAPRALLVTLMVRLGACDLFVHGTGGASYDRVTEAWAEAWLGRALSPDVAVTADVRLPIHDREVSERDLSDAIWRAHSARHNPALLGDESAQNAKRSLLEKIEAARESGEDPSTYFQELHANRRTYEFAHASELATLDARVKEIERLLSERDVARKRDWPAALYSVDALRALKSGIDGSFTNRASSPAGAEAISRPS